MSRPAQPAMPAEVDPSLQGGSTRRRIVMVALALLSLFLTGAWLAGVAQTDPWYRNTDMNIHNMVDALALNSGVAPNAMAQPAVPLKYLLALDYRVRHRLGWLPVWNLERFGASADPLTCIPPLIRAGRVHSRILVLAFILSAAWLTHGVTRKINWTCLTVILLCGSSGLLFHGLLTRPELLCVLFGNILALLCTWRATAARPWFKNHAWLFLAGIFCGLAALEKLPGICYLALCYGWCWLAALTAAAPGPGARPPSEGKRPFWAGLLPAVGGVSVLWLLLQLAQYQDVLGPVVILRLRVAAVFVGVLPLLAGGAGRNRLWLFFLERGRELALLGGGALATLPLSYLLLRGLLAEPRALDYITGVLRFLLDPAPSMEGFLGDSPDVGQVFMIYFQQDAFLFISAPAMVLGVLLVPSIPRRLKAFITLLLAGALGMTLLMSKRHFLAQYSIYPQVPLLLVWSLSLYGLWGWLQKKYPPERVWWVLPVTVAVAFVLVLGVHPEVREKYTTYQDDAALPVNDLTLTFLFDHDAHTPAYRRIMAEHYGDRKQFSNYLEHYLANPANRY